MPKEEYDVVVVGSGAAGGVLASRLARLGARVAILEGGPKIDSREAFHTHTMPYEFKLRRVPITREGDLGFSGERVRAVGGKTLLWNAVALRLSQRDLEGYTREGVGADWPISYGDLEPYYTQIEASVGVCGHRDGWEDLPDGNFLPPMPLKCVDQILRKGCKKLGIPVLHVRKATLTKARDGRPPCHYCGNCMAGCDVVAKYNSADVHLFPALETKRLTILPNRIAYRINHNGDNRVTAVHYLDRLSRRDGEVQGKVIAVCCACVQSIALLRMSASAEYPNGLGNSSGTLGRHFIPHLVANHTGVIHDLLDRPYTHDEGALDHGYIPSFMHLRRRDYARSFAIQYNYQNPRQPAWWIQQIPGFGVDFKKRVRSYKMAALIFRPNLEMLPNEQSYVDLDPQKKDEYGLPLARRHLVPGENEMKMFADCKRITREVFDTVGITLVAAPETLGRDHELGGCRMGKDPRTSMLNGFCQSHVIPNLFVVDGSVFPSGSEKNPTLTIMALAARTADYIWERFGR